MKRRRSPLQLLRGGVSSPRSETDRHGSSQLRQGGAREELSDEHGRDGRQIVHAIGTCPGLTDEQREALTERVAEWVLVARAVYADSALESAVIASLAVAS